MQQLGVDKKTELVKAKRQVWPITCPATNSSDLSIVGASSESQQAFRDFLRRTSATETLDFVDQAVLWALFQIKVRPDFAAPTARLQFLSRTKQGTRFWDFTAPEREDRSYPFFHGLSSFLKGHNKKKPLSYYSGLLDRNFKGPVTIDQSFAGHLASIKEEIGADATLRRYWFRGDEVLQLGERLPHIELGPLVRIWEKNPIVPVTAPPFFSYRRTPKLDVSCNYDLTLYDNSIFLIDKEENQGHLFGITNGNEAFLAVTAQKSTPVLTLENSPIFKGSAKVRSTAFCVVQRPEGEVWLAANQSRDPGQHVYHLFRYGLGNVRGPKDVEKLLRHARHMFLSDPLRLIIESTRSRDEQVKELLKLNIPIYNAAAIGNVWSWAKLSDKSGAFYIDDRNPGTLLCPQ